MAAIPVTISNAVVDEANATITGDLSLTGLEVGGGPMPGGPGKPPGAPTFPIWGPPGMELPPVPGYPPVAGHPLPPTPTPPDPTKPPAFLPIWHPDYGWIVVPVFPVPTPSKKK
jgi:hypothetical protein